LSLAIAIFKVLFPFIAGAVAHALHRAHIKERELIEKRIHNESLKLTLLHLDDVVAAVGVELFRELTQLASTDDLTPESRDQLVAIYLGKARQFLGKHRENDLGQLLGLVEDALLGFITSKLEAKVHDLEQRSPAGQPLPDAGIRLAPPTLA
jgi:hypothetical protein